MEVLQCSVCLLPLCKSETKLCQQHVGGKARRADTSSGLWRSSQLADSQHSSALTADGKLLSPLSSLCSTFLPSQLLLCLLGLFDLGFSMPARGELPCTDSLAPRRALTACGSFYQCLRKVGKEYRRETGRSLPGGAGRGVGLGPPGKVPSSESSHGAPWGLGSPSWYGPKDAP